MKFDIESLRALQALAETGSLQATADQLSVSRSVVSRKLKRLQEETGCDLVRRDDPRVSLTDDGIELLSYGRQIIATHDAAVRRFLPADTTGLLRVGAIEGASSTSLLDTVVPWFQRHGSGVDLRISIEQPMTLDEWLDEGRIDLAVTVALEEDIRDDDIVLDRDDLVWAHSAGTDIPNTDPVPLITWGPRCFFGTLAGQLLSAAGIDHRMNFELPTIAAVRTALNSGAGVALLTSGFITNTDIASTGPPTLPEPPRLAYILRQRTHASDNALRDFVVEQIQTSFRRPPAGAPAASTFSLDRTADDEGDREVSDVWELFTQSEGSGTTAADNDHRNGDQDESDLWALFTEDTSRSANGEGDVSIGALSAGRGGDISTQGPLLVQDPPMSSTAEGDLIRILAELLDVDTVSSDSNFFDDLGADSLVMAHFCARVAKYDGLPRVSIREVYENPTIAQLVAHLTLDDANGSDEPVGLAIPPPPPWSGRRVSTPMHLLCGTLQGLLLIALALLAGVGASQGYSWIVDADGTLNTYERSVVFGSIYFGVWTTLPIAAKWLLIGRWKAQYIRIWSLSYVRFWLVNLLVRANPIGLFAGSPIYTFYLRLLGARIGKGTVILSRQVGVCADLFTAGDNAVVRSDAVIKCYRAQDGYIQTGPTTLGSNSLVGVASVLEIYSSLGNDAQLGHSSSLGVGQVVPDGEHVVGSPARQHTDFDYMSIRPVSGGQTRRAGYAIGQVMALVGFSIPLGVLLPLILFRLPFAPDIAALADSAASRWTVAWSVVQLSLVAFFGALLFSILVAVTVPRLFSRVFAPNVVYPLYGFRYGLHRFIARVTNVPIFNKMFGDSSFIVHYLYLLGYGVTFEGQTGANFGQTVRHDSPYFLTFGAGTMVADGLTLANTEFSPTSFMLAPVDIAQRSFLGNGIFYPSQGKTGENCLHASKLMVPCDGEIRKDIGLLGSPSFEIPRTVERDKNFEEVWKGEARKRGLAQKNRHNLVSIGLFIFARWLAAFGLLAFAALGSVFYSRFGALSGLILPVTLVVGSLYNVLVERASLGFSRLQPVTCSIYEIETWRVERFWKFSWNPAFLNGTPMKSIAWRLLGLKIGKRVFDDGCGISERTMTTVGDDCTLNSGAMLQAHSLEDGAFKSDYIVIGSNCTLGTGSLVQYGVTMGDGVKLETSSFLMKGTAAPPNTVWGENPAREVSAAPHGHEQTLTANATGRPVIETREMTLEQTEGSDFWRRMLLDGGFTPIPRWTLEPARGAGTSDFPIEDTLARDIEELGGQLSVSTDSIYLAAHAKVLAALTGERDLTTGYVPSRGSQPLPCRLSVESDSWQGLIQDCDRVRTDVETHQDFPIHVLQQELEHSTPTFETVLSTTGSKSLGDQIVFSVSLVKTDGGPVLRLDYRTESLNDEAVIRIGGYYVRALELMTSGPDSPHREQSLLSEDELRVHLEELVGPNRELPDFRFHELFEQRVREHPEAIAAVSGDRRWSYSELNSRANQLGRALMARGARRETVVAVVTERNLDWMASVLAILKIGAAYLPIEPHFPADRIANMLTRAECRLVITELKSTETLYQAMSDLRTVKGFFAETAYREGRADHDLGIDVGTDQLAYIYFTSGSTGQPKGAMCEHLGMLNHLYAKIDDLEIREGQSVAQIAPQCFDISLWQLISALLVGGSTILIDQDTLLDPKRFIDQVLSKNIAVLQVVPSYLEVLLTYLEENPVDLGDLHCVSVTGEALTLELAHRWFRCQPGIKLANAYGLTETSDDTNHEVMTEPPSGDRVPLGPAINNVEVRVVDETLTPVPLGAPGEIVFGGVCVGRGYINDPERTRAAFVDDPMFEGHRLYRSGDFGRWRPDGKLEFLGRRDAQVKIRGFRIEIGDIENALYQVEGIRQAAVVITSRDDGNQQLVAFYAGDELPRGEPLANLRSSLPDYMVPSAAYYQESLPLSDNGKIDRKILRALAQELQVIDLTYEAPENPNEIRLAEIWSDILSIPTNQIGRLDNFFDRGGSSLSAVRVVIALDRAVSLKDVTQQPVLADLAAMLDGNSERDTSLLHLLSEEADSAEGAVVCLPYAGGNAINFKALAQTLKGRGPTVYAVDLPGHDVAAEREDFVRLEVIVDRIVDEIVERNLHNVLLWGQSSGTALALETALRLEARNVDVRRVFLGAQLLGSTDERLAHLRLLEHETDAQISERLTADGGYTELGQLNQEQAEHVGAAYRHDCTGAHKYFISHMQRPPTFKLKAPLTVVVAADDPTLTESTETFSDWRLFADRVDYHQLAEGGHYFLRTRPADAAEVILSSLSPLALSE